MLKNFTLAIIKPDLIISKQSKLAYDLILNNGFQILKNKEITLKKEDAERFYGEHKGKFFYGRLIHFMTSGQIHPLLLTHPEKDTISQWRELMGPTHIEKARLFPDTIRGKFATSDTRNCVHGSDAESTALNEAKFFFPELIGTDL